jgi:hypothetical protein
MVKQMNRLNRITRITLNGRPAKPVPARSALALAVTLACAFAALAAGCESLVGIHDRSQGSTGAGGQPGGTGGLHAGGTGGGPTGTGGLAGGGTGGAPGTGGSGTGGIAGGGTGGMTGTGGTPGTGGAVGSGGAGGSGNPGTGGGAGSGGPADCSALPLCDTFESESALNTTLWTLIPTAATGTATIDTIGAHGSGHSLKVVSPDRLYLRNSSVIGTLGPVVHVRYYVRFNAALAQGHAAMIVTHPTAVDQYSQSNELRFGGQDSVYHWNTDSDAANIPDVSPNGDAASFKPVAATWYCVELVINTTNGHLSVSIDGNDIPGLDEDGVATANIDQSWISSGTTSLSRYTALADFNFGWQSYGGGAMTLWYDDVALSASPIGCQ